VVDRDTNPSTTIPASAKMIAILPRRSRPKAVIVVMNEGWRFARDVPEWPALGSTTRRCAGVTDR
jgi:hypothetical protein